jgi:hypothetical protein
MGADPEHGAGMRGGAVTSRTARTGYRVRPLKRAEARRRGLYRLSGGTTLTPTLRNMDACTSLAQLGFARAVCQFVFH